MRYGYGNAIGSMVAILIGLCAFGGWLYVCYPATATELADESRQSWSFLVLLVFVVVAVIGVVIAGSVFHGLMMLLRSTVQLALIAGLVGGGIWIWRNQSSDIEPQVQVTRYEEPQRPAEKVELPPPESPKGKWWQQNRSE